MMTESATARRIDRLARPLLHVGTNKHYIVTDFDGRTYTLESISGPPRKATADELRDPGQWR